jgi:benzoate membrane transport protein
LSPNTSPAKKPPLRWADVSVSAVTAGFVAMLVGLTSTVALVFQAATVFGATPAQISSWLWALGLGMAVCCILPALWLRQPVMVAWSTPGAAVLVAAGTTGSFNMAEATGAFIVFAAAVMLFGVTGWFERLQNRVPMAIAGALLAGVLTRFGLNAFLAVQTALPLTLWMLGAYILGKRLWPRFTVPVVLLVGVVYAAVMGQMRFQGLQWGFTTPVFTLPTFNVRSLISLALPLFVVTMTAQNLPGAAVIRANGYNMPISKIVTLTGLATMVFAPFGAFALSLSAVTAAMCIGPASHPDPAKRYVAAVSCGVFYVLMGLFGASVTALLLAFPKELVIVIAGLALIGNIGHSLTLAVQTERHREAALITFLVTLSGISLGGIGSAFWGVVAGILTLAVMRWRVTASE